MARRPSRIRPAPRRRPVRLVAGDRRPAPWWQWLLGVMVLGAFGYFLYWLATDASSGSALSPPPAGSTPAEPMPPPKPEGTPKKPLAKPAPKEPRFTFYTMLPEKEVIIPEGEIRARKRAESLGAAGPGNYFIQAGSFRNLKDADRLKAQLALLGMEARIEEAAIGGVIWHRVRIGPYPSLREVERVRARLRRHRIDSVVQTARR